MSARPWFLLALILIGARARAEDEDGRLAKIDLSLLFVGTMKDAPTARGQAARTKDFVDFLSTQFTSVTAADRNQFDPSLANGVDVVLLDWSQSEVDLAKWRELPSPLGERKAWRHPTVFLGSAGLLMTSPWQLKGDHG
jgi:hypothetical protein